MKKTLFCLLMTVFVSSAINAQLNNSKWKGVLKLDNPVNVTFNFAKDTLTVVNLDQTSIIETMIFTADKATFTVQKISGQSDCPISTVGKYKYSIKDNVLLMTVVDDVCDDRAPYLNNLQLTKNAL